ncbi:MAG TPA: fumarylacetoacetate hydrolase family protein [Candidatus Elarobacter sp.]
MRLAQFRTPSAGSRPAVVDGDQLRPIEGLSSLDALIALAPDARTAALKQLGAPVPLAGATLLSPLMPKKNVFCVGRNYLGHAAEGARARGEELKLPPVPTFFTKAPTSITGHDATLNLQANASQKYDWEAELAVVIGTRCKNVSEADALSVVYGYTCLNDVSARDLQNATTQWFKGKTLDDTCPIGPWIVTADELDPHTLDIKLRVNGVEKQSDNTSTFIFNINRIIAYLSLGTTLEPGDVIATGTPEGVGFARTPPEFLSDGDVMEVDIAKIGVLRNRVSIS